MTIESLITALVDALDRNTAAHLADTKPAKEKKGKTETAQPAAAVTATTSAPVAAVIAQPAAQPAATPSGPDSKTVADAVIKLANEHSREAAVSILAKVRPGGSPVTRVSDLKPEHYADVMAEVAAATAKAIADKANASLV
jgi:hypothetical protein